jgi:hypothetical protein
MAFIVGSPYQGNSPWESSKCLPDLLRRIAGFFLGVSLD